MKIIQKIIDFILSFFSIFSSRKEKNSYSYKKKDFLLTKKELSFYHFLQENLADKYSIMCSVRVIDIIEPVDKKDFTAKAKIIQKHIDFLVCTKWYLNPVLAIELNDWTHRSKDRYERDNFLDLAFQSAGLPLLFVSTRDIQKKEYVRSLLSEFVDLK